MERIAQDGSVFSQGEALAELPLMYHIDEFSLDEMINAVRDVKNLAQSLTTIPENTSFKVSVTQTWLLVFEKRKEKRE